MRIPDGGVRGILEEIQDHFAKYLYHQLLRRIFDGLDVSRTSWQRIHEIVDGDLALLSDGTTASPPDLYETVGAFAEFTRACRIQICGRIRELVGASLGWGTEERMLRDITISSFDANLAKLNGLVRGLYMTVEQLDREENGDNAAIKQFRDLPEQMRQLTGGCRPSGESTTTQQSEDQNDQPE